MLSRIRKATDRAFSGAIKSRPRGRGSESYHRGPALVSKPIPSQESGGSKSDGVAKATPLIKTNHSKTIDPSEVGSRHPAAVFWGERLNAGEFPANELAGKINWAERSGYDTAKYKSLNDSRGYSYDDVSSSASPSSDDGLPEPTNDPIRTVTIGRGGDGRGGTRGDGYTGDGDESPSGDSGNGNSSEDPGVEGDCFGCKVKNFVSEHKLVIAIVVTLLIFLVFRKFISKKEKEVYYE